MCIFLHVYVASYVFFINKSQVYFRQQKVLFLMKYTCSFVHTKLMLSTTLLFDRPHSIRDVEEIERFPRRFTQKLHRNLQSMEGSCWLTWFGVINLHWYYKIVFGLFVLILVVVDINCLRNIIAVSFLSTVISYRTVAVWS